MREVPGSHSSGGIEVFMIACCVVHLGEAGLKVSGFQSASVAKGRGRTRRFPSLALETKSCKRRISFKNAS